MKPISASDSMSALMDEFKEKVKRVLSWAGGGKAGPLSLTIGVTHSCNLACRFCPQRNIPGAAKREVPLPVLLRLVRESAALGAIQCNVSGGGEPFLRSTKMIELMVEIKANRMLGSVTTNGTCFTGDMIRRLVAAGWNQVNFSIDAPDAAVHDALRGRAGAFEKTTRAMLAFRREKERHGKDRPHVAVMSVLCRDNRLLLPEMVKLVSRLGADRITFVPLIVRTPQGAKLKVPAGRDPRFETSLRRAIEEAEKLRVSHNLRDFEDRRLVEKTSDMDEVIREHAEEASSAIDNPFAGAACFEPWLLLCLHPYGHIDPCEYESLKSRAGERSLAEIWFEDSHLNRMRQGMLKGRLPDYCRSCCEPLVAGNQRLREELCRRLASKRRATAGSGSG